MCFKSKGVCFGVVICLDSVYFEPARLLALQQATILFSPMCNKVPLNHSYAKRPLYYSHFVARSYENRCWLVSADWVWKSDGQIVCPGNTVIYNPLGQEVARSAEGLEQMLLYDIPKESLREDRERDLKGSLLLNRQLVEFLEKN